jgi:hypothetical protein
LVTRKMPPRTWWMALSWWFAKKAPLFLLFDMHHIPRSIERKVFAFWCHEADSSCRKRRTWSSTGQAFGLALRKPCGRLADCLADSWVEGGHWSTHGLGFFPLCWPSEGCARWHTWIRMVMRKFAVSICINTLECFDCEELNLSKLTVGPVQVQTT